MPRWATSILATIITGAPSLPSSACSAATWLGSGRIIGYIFGIDVIAGIWITTAAVWLYTIAGGLVSVAYTDLFQAAVGWTGLMAGSIWCLVNLPRAAGVSPAYPVGDSPAVAEQMSNNDALDPIPNAIVFNWVATKRDHCDQRPRLHIADRHIA